MPFDLFDSPAEPPTPAEPRVLTVSELTRTVRSVLETRVGQVWVEGEVSNYRRQSSGHQYFTLKDENSQVSCVLFARASGARKAVPLADGMCVQVRGLITVYEARGQYQLNVQLVQASGAGLLQARFEALKRRLDAEGLFDPARKRPLPPHPAAVGIVTSPTGAALRDMLNVLSRRAPWLPLVIAPARVQGAGAAAEIVAGIAALNRLAASGTRPIQVIIIARGGGSAEDLWEFNEEAVARAVRASALPVISAVGHEIDFTISDFAADLRAPTPSAAAELVVPDRDELLRQVRALGASIAKCASVQLARRRQTVATLARSALFREPRARLNEAAQRLDHAADALRRRAREALATRSHRLARALATIRHHQPLRLLALRRQELARVSDQLRRALEQRTIRERHRLALLEDRIRLLSPQATLERGYSLTTGEGGKLVTSVTAVTAGTRLQTRFQDGSALSVVEDVQQHAASKSSPSV